MPASAASNVHARVEATPVDALDGASGQSPATPTARSGSNQDDPGRSGSRGQARRQRAVARLGHIVSAFVFLALASATPVFAAAGDAVAIKDAALRGCIETALDKSAGETITEGELAGLSELRCEAKSVADLAGLEYATGLTTLLRLSTNDITDLTPLAGLVSLQALYIDQNPVRQDLSPLANLVNLKDLGLHGITAHCDPPIGCTYGPLDYSALGRLTKLERLDISYGSEELLAEVSSLTALKELYVSNAFIWDISPLMENRGLDSALIEMRHNPLGCAAISEDIPALRARGANVVVDSVPSAVPKSPKKLKVVRGKYKARLSWKFHRNEVVNVFEARYAKESEDNFGDWQFTGGGDRPSTGHGFGTDGPPYGDAEGLDPDARYLFEVRGVNTAGCGVIGRVSAEPYVAEPKADAGKDRTVPEDGKAQLDGSGSSGPSGQTLTYSWRQSAGSPSVTIEGADTATPSFATPNLVAPATLTFELTVTAGEASATDMVDITIDADNDPPTARAGKDQTVAEASAGSLDAAGSSDPEGEPLAYSWRQSGGEPTLTLTGANTATPSFTTPNLVAPTTLTFELTATAGGASTTDTVNVTIDADNDSPTANAGEDQTVAAGGVGRLDGSASSDPEGESLDYSWRQSAGEPSVALAEARTAAPSFKAPIVTTNATLTFELTVTAGGASATDTVEVTIQAAAKPVAHAGKDRTVAEDGEARLDGSGSSGPAGKTLAYSWRQTSGEPSVSLSGADTATPSFATPNLVAPTTLTFELTVSVAEAKSSDTVDVTIDADNDSPTANAGEDQTIDAGSVGRLDGGASSDPEGESLDYSWRQSAGEPSVALAEARTATPAFKAPIVTTNATLTFELTVTAGGASATDTVDVTIDAGAPTVAIADAHLRQCIEKALGKEAGESPTEDEMATLTGLRCSAARGSGGQMVRVASLAGLEHASNLASLEINGHAVSDLSPLSGLTSLRRLMASSGAIADVSPLAKLTRLMELRIAANRISDVTPLANLTALRTLDVGKNAIADISALAGLTSLTYLGIYYNGVSDVSAIKGMTGLKMLSMYRNAVADIGVVSGLTSLVDLNAENNDIWDISALAANTGLGPAASLYLAKNPLGCAAVSAVAGLEAKGVSVSVDAADAAPGAPANLAVEMASGTATLTWDAPKAGTVRVHEVRHRPGADGVFGNWEMVPGGAESRSHSVSDLADGSHAFEVRAVNSAGCGEAARISTDSVASPTVSIPDSRLRQCIEKALDKTPGEPTTEAEMATLTNLLCTDVRNEAGKIVAQVASLAGLEHATSLVQLQITDHAVSDLSPLSGLASLRRLYAGRGSLLADVSPLANLTGLTDLRVANSNISDLTPLAGLTSLRHLEVGQNAVADISALAGLTSLTELNIYSNHISDISAIAGMTSLEWLNMSANEIVDIGATRGLTALLGLTAELNDIWDISALTANAGIGNGTIVSLAQNPLGCAAVPAVAELRARGARVHVDSAEAAPAAPANLAVEVDDGTATLTWDAPQAGTVRVHEVRRRSGANGVFGSWEMVPGGGESRSHRVSDLADGSHAFEVRAVNAAGCSTAARISTASASPTVSIPDRRLRQCVEKALGKTTGEPTTEAEMATLTNLLCATRNDERRTVNEVASLAGLEHATSLVQLQITNHAVSDLSPLSGLASLRRLYAGGGPLTDVSPLANLTGLTDLRVAANSISDLTPLAGLTSLRHLEVGSNAISDISALAGLTALTFLGITSNAISDISAISGMTRLETLQMDTNAVADIDAVSGLTSIVYLTAEYNNIWDISALTANRGIGSAKLVALAENPLGCAAVAAVAELRARGATVHVSSAEAAPAAPANLAVEMADGAATLTWDAPPADTVRVHEVRRRSGANGFGSWEMVPGGGESRSHRVPDLAGGSHAFEVRAVNAEGCSTAARASIGGATVSIKDASLRYCVERELDKASGSAITEDDMASIERLRCRVHGPDRSPHGAIRSLEGLQFATGLRSLSIQGNAVSDLSPIAQLPLATLDIYHNAVTDFSALTSLQSLTTLGAGGNPTSDLAPLGGLTGLTTLSMVGSALVDISPLGHLTNLTTLWLGGNAISDVSALAALTSLETLGLSGNAISDISPLADLKSMTTLMLVTNAIVDVSPLRDLTSLHDLRLRDNRIADVGALVRNLGLGKGDYIELSENLIPCGANAMQIQTLRRRGAVVYADEGPLSPPLDLAGTPGDASATLTWRAPEGCVVGYYEYRHGTGEPLVFNAWTDIGGDTTHTVSGLTNGVLHAFEVRALGTSDGNWGDSSRVDVTLAADPDAPVEIHDPQLSKALAERLSDGEQAQDADDGDAAERTITQGDLATFTSLSLDDLGIAKLNGLEYAINLGALRLSGNAIATLVPIGELPVLTTLWASDNNLTDISALAGLVALTELALDGNAISDLSALSQLSSLTRLWLNDNAIADIGPLVTNTGLGSGEVSLDGSSDYIDLRGNPLGTVALGEHAPALRGRGAAVLVDDGSHAVPVFLAAGSPFGESFVRILSRAGKAGEVSIVAIDAAGRRFGPTTFTLGAGRTMRIDSDDLEQGNPAIGLASGVGVGQGDWRLELRSALSDMEVHAYTRTKTGLVASMNVLAPEAYARHRLLTFDRDGNTGRLRVINPASKVARALIEGVDGGGNAATVAVEVPAGTVRDFDAAALEAGTGTGVVSGGLGQGAGEWRLRVTSYDGVHVLNLASSAAQLTNLSAMPLMADASKPQHLPLIPAAEWPVGRSGFLRFVNYSAEAGSVEVRAFDHDGRARDPVTLVIGAGSAVRLTPADLAQGSAAKGLPKGVGEGAWRLELRSSSDVYAGSYMRSGESAPLVAMHSLAPRLSSGDSDVVFFNPASSELTSRLRLVNVGTASARVAITAIDDSGASPGRVVRVTIPAGATREFTAFELETGKADGLSGELGNGSGQWRLLVASDGDIHVVSLVESTTGYAGNVSR